MTEGLDFSEILRMMGALCLVVGLMAALMIVLKKAGLAAPALPRSHQRRLKVVEVLTLDSRRRLFLIQRDEKQHLVILGPSSETVIERDIDAPVKQHTVTP